MADPTRHMDLIQWIRNELINGIVLTDDVLFFLEATFGTRDLPGILADGDACELDSLMELLFFPDAALQERYEVRWGREIFSAQDQEKVIAALCEQPMVVHVAVPDTDITVALPVPAFAIQSLIERLNICWRPPDKLFVENVEAKTKVQLRNARIAWHSNQVDLISRFLSKMPAAETFASDLDFLLTIIAEMPEKCDAYGFLIDKKFFYFKSLSSAEEFERKRLTSNMEILMLSGERSAHGSIDEWRKYMHRVDRICQNLFGRTQFFHQPDQQSIDFKMD